MAPRLAHLGRDSASSLVSSPATDAQPPFTDKDHGTQSQSRDAALEQQSCPAHTQPDPADGATAWLCTLGTFLMFSCTWGPAQSYGVFQSYYASHLLQSHSASEISWIGGITNLLLVCSGLWSGPLFDRGYLKVLLATGMAVCTLGYMLLSICSEYWQVLLTQGLLFGGGAGLIQIPLYSTLSLQFGPRKRAVAVGVAACGSSVGGVVFPIVLSRLFAQVGFAWACRTVGFLQLSAGVVGCALLFQAPVKLGRPCKTFVFGALREPPFLVHCMGVMCLFLAYWIPLFYTTDYAIYRLGSSQELAFYLVSVINGGSALGRLAPSFVIIRAGALPVLWACSLVAVVLLFAWMAVGQMAGFVAWCALFGFATGCLVSATPVANVHPVLSPHKAELGSRLGLVWFFSGVGALIGNPIAGALAQPQAGQFAYAQAFAGAVMAAGVVLLAFPTWRTMQYDRRQRQQADATGAA